MPEIVKVKRRKVKWVLLCLTFDQGYRNARRGLKYEGSACFNCERAFKDGERIAIVGFEKGLNKVVCGTCAETLQRQLQADAQVEIRGELL